MSSERFNLLFLCVGNSARSIMAEALLNRFGNDKFQAFSAGTDPAPAVHPMTLQVMRLHGLSTEGFRSKSWQEFVAPGAVAMDFVISVCEEPPPELLVAFPGDPVRAHWRITDPASLGNNHVERMNAFRVALRELETRIRLFVLLRHSARSSTARGNLPPSTFEEHRPA